jgi:hypothetical protein
VVVVVDVGVQTLEMVVVRTVSSNNKTGAKYAPLFMVTVNA